MIKGLRGWNFQSHKHTELVLHEGVNIICGISTTGKSALFRLVRWVKENRPLGLVNKSRFAEKDDVMAGEIEIEEGLIRLEKNSGTATYTVNGKDYNPGTDVPDEVIKLLNLDDVNIQDQFDVPFLICSTPGEVARVFNSVTNVEKVDVAVSKLTTQINAMKRDIAGNSDHLIELRKKLASFDDLDDIEDFLREVELLAEQFTAKQKEVIELDNAVISLQKTADSIDSLKEFIDKAEKTVGHLERYVNRIQSFREEREDIENVLALHEKVERAMTEYARAEHNYKCLLETLQICPMCLTELDDHKIDHILEEVSK